MWYWLCITTSTAPTARRLIIASVINQAASRLLLGLVLRAVLALAKLTTAVMGAAKRANRNSKLAPIPPASLLELPLKMLNRSNAADIATAAVMADIARGEVFAGVSLGFMA